MFRTNKKKLDIKDIKSFVEEDKKKIGRLKKLQNYYEGKHEIIEKAKKREDGNMPNNAIVNPYAKYIVDMLTGYFIGQPIRYSAIDNTNKVDDKLLEKLNEIFKYNDEQENNLELAKTCSIKGLGYEIMWADKDANIRFKHLQPDGVFLIYDNTLEDNIVRAIRYYDRTVDGKECTYIEEYSKDMIHYYNSESGELKLEYEKPHFFGDVPIIMYENNQEQMGDFEPIISLIDAYDLAQSNTLNDMEQFTDAYLVLVNMLGTDDEDIRKLRKDRVLLHESDGDAKWLIKDVNDAWVENYKNRLKGDIHKFSYTPDMTDEKFGTNLSGVSLRYKLIAMEQLRANKERKFKKGIQRRIELICNYLKIQDKEIVYTGIGMQFSNTLPQNILETSQIITNLSNYLSTETLIEQLPFVENAKEEMNKKKAEEDESSNQDFENYSKLKAMLGKEDMDETDEE